LLNDERMFYLFYFEGEGFNSEMLNTLSSKGFSLTVSILKELLLLGFWANVEEFLPLLSCWLFSLGKFKRILLGFLVTLT
jgi:hypothetical protein